MGIPEIVLGFLSATVLWVQMPNDFAAWLQKWQTLVGALVATVAASIAFYNTTRSIRHTEKLETRRRKRKHAALRAVLPLALAQVIDYAARSARALNDLVHQCSGGALAPMTAPADFVQSLPSEILESLADFIEYSDMDVRIVEDTVAWIQIHDSRLRSLVERNRDPSGLHIVLQSEIKRNVIDAASIYAGAAAVFDYARRRQEQLPSTVLWEAVRNVLIGNMQLWDSEYEALSAGPRRPDARRSFRKAERMIALPRPGHDHCL